MANTKLRAGQPIRYEPITEGKVDLDLKDKEYQWHSELTDEDVEMLETPSEP